MNVPAPARRNGTQPVPLTCVVCRQPISQASQGRVRLFCDDATCRSVRRRQRRTPARWTVSDWAEALVQWAECCAVCGQLMTHPVAVQEILPAHYACRSLPLPRRAQAWLDKCAPGTPLPNPWAGVVP